GCCICAFRYDRPNRDYQSFLRTAEPSTGPPYTSNRKPDMPLARGRRSLPICPIRQPVPAETILLSRGEQVHHPSSSINHHPRSRNPPVPSKSSRDRAPYEGSSF